MKKRILPPTYFFAAVAAMIALHFIAPLYRWAFWPWNLLGILPIALGAAFTVWADREFKRAGTTVKPFEQSGSLVNTGPFRFSRHPMYIGMTAILVGISIILGTLTPIFPAISFVLVMALRFIPSEERMMEEKFGQEYSRYRDQVRRWL